MDLSNAQKETTPFVKVTTTAAFPKVTLSNDPEDAERAIVNEAPDPSEKVVLSYCSELAEHTLPVTLFDAKHKLRIFHDGEERPIVLTAGTDERLYGLLPTGGIGQGWKAIDLTPGESKDTKIVAFDAIELETCIYAAVAVNDIATKACIIYHGKLDKLGPSADDDDAPKAIDATVFGWQPVANNLGSKVITTLTCSYSSFSESLSIAVGTAKDETQKLAASHYLVTVDNEAAPWQDIPLPATADRISEISVGMLPNSPLGVLFVSFKDGSQNSRIIANFITADGGISHEIHHMHRLLPGTIGNVQDFSVSPNPWNCTDVVVAGTKGIGFYNFKAITKEPQTVPELDGISFKQVVCTEYGTSTSTSSTINILAVSSQGELYFVEGHRQYHDNSIRFETTGLPIQVGVRMVAVRFSGLLDSSEVCYVGTGVSASGSAAAEGNQISHIYRCAKTSAWTSSKITVLAKEKTMRSKAYLTTVKLQNSEGTPVPIGYPIQLSSPSVPFLTTINGKAICVGPQPTEITTTDASGCVLLITPASDILSAPVFTVSLPKYNTAARNDSTGRPSVAGYELYTNQRVIWLLKNKAPTAKDLENSRDANGKALFHSSADFSGAASIMSSFNSMSISFDKDNDGSSDLNKSWTIDENGKLVENEDHEKDWFENAVDVTGKFIGDVVEFLKTAVKGVVKLGIHAAKGVVKLLIEIGGSPVQFILETLGELVKGVLGAVTRLLGATAKALLDVFGLWPDKKFVHDTHEVLSDVVHSMLSMTELFFEANESTIEMAADKLAEQARGLIKDTRPAKTTNANGGPPKDNPLMKVIQNPVFQSLLKFNPIAWIAEAVNEEINIDGLELPDFGPLVSIFAEALPDLALKQLENLQRFFEDLKKKCGRFLSDRDKILDIFLEVASDAFWTIFDAIKEIILAAYKVAGKVIAQMRILLEFPMKIPFLSRTFEDETGLPFSLVNLGTYLLSFIMCLGRKTNPSDTIRPVVSYMKSLTREDLDLKRAFGWIDDDNESPEHEFEAQLQQQALVQRTGRLDFQNRKPDEDPQFGLMSGGSEHQGLEHLSHVSSAAVALTRLLLTFSEVIVPYNDAVHSGNLKGYERQINRGVQGLQPPVHPLPENDSMREALEIWSKVFAFVNVVGHAGNLIVAFKHPVRSCKRIGWSVSSTACSAIAFVLSFHFCKIPPDYKPAVVSGVSTIASICQIISEDELTTEMRALHFVGCGAGAVVAIATLLRKAQPEVAIALGGFGVIVDFPITLIAGVKDIADPHHGSMDEAARKTEEKKHGLERSAG